jgi:hypothetical protein
MNHLGLTRNLCLLALGLVIMSCDRAFKPPPPDPATFHPPLSIALIRVNNDGNLAADGANYAMLVNPRSPELDFKVNVGLSHAIYTKSAGQVKRNYIGKVFSELIRDDNAKLNGQLPFAAINADYIDPQNHPQGLNLSRGWDYSGEFQNSRSSFGIAGGDPATRRATIQKGRRSLAIANYNVVGGNGRFYEQGKFIDICPALGQYACVEATERSLAAITKNGYVIFLVHHNTNNENVLLPAAFQPLLQTIAKQYKLGDIQDGILFDGGISPGMAYQNQILVENSGPIGSVFLIYKKSP